MHIISSLVYFPYKYYHNLFSCGILELLEKLQAPIFTYIIY